MPEQGGIDCPCVSCGYDLRGLPEDSACPECGTAVSRSLRGDRLSAADVPWLARISRGQRLIAGAMVLSVGSVLAAIVLAIVFGLTTLALPNLPRVVEDVVTAVIAGAVMGVPVALCLGSVGVFLLTAQEGRERERESPWSARNVARWSILGAVATSAVVLPLRYVPRGGTAVEVADATAIALLIAFVTIASVSVLKRLAAMVRRVPDDPLARRIDKTWRFIRWAMPVAAVWVLVARRGNFGLLTATGIGSRVASMVEGCAGLVGWIAVVGLLGIATQLVGITRQCASRFRTALAIAEQT